MRCGIDTYSYHRLFGLPRNGEPAPSGRMIRDWREPLAEARSLAVDTLALQTMFLDEPEQADLQGLRGAAGDIELVLSWGGLEGLRFGADLDAQHALERWLAAAAAIELSLMRIVVGGPGLRGAEPLTEQLRRTVPVLRRASMIAGDAGIVLAVENHGDLTVAELLELLQASGDDKLGICLDVANTLRLGEDPIAAARLAGPRVRMVHLRDCDDPAGADRVTGPRVRPYGEGVVPVEAVLEALLAAGFDGPVCVELAQLGPGDDERRLVALGVEWLRAWQDRHEARSGASRSAS